MTRQKRDWVSKNVTEINLIGKRQVVSTKNITVHTLDRWRRLAKKALITVCKYDEQKLAGDVWCTYNR